MLALVQWLSEAQLWAGFPEIIMVACWLLWLLASHPRRVHRQELFPCRSLIRTKESLSWKFLEELGPLVTSSCKRLRMQIQ